MMEETLSLKKFNELFENFYNTRNGMSAAKKVFSTESKYDEGESYYEVYELEGELFLKIRITYDSYGNEHVSGLSFVKPIEKTITEYTTI